MQESDTNRQANKGGRTYNSRSYEYDRSQCQLCNKYGHTARTCWFRYSEDQYEEEGFGGESYSNTGRNQHTQPQANLSNLIATPATAHDSSWYPDSGATHHMTHDEKNLMEKEEYHENEQVVVGNGTGAM
ncbi:uncharacterized protein [Arachis hypogaea]|uniref:uncharacterized protein n=1 Tax=Arachis hypogaea TaxID=3818 RepID=UPI003B21DE42